MSSGEEDVGALTDLELQQRFATGQLTGSSGYKIKPRSSIVPRMITKTDNAGMDAQREEVGIIGKLSWVETFIVSSTLDDDVDAEDDLTRENLFYDHSLQSIEEAVRNLKKAKIPIQRPDDYYAEMLKTDDHMRKVREKMLGETQKIEASERARKQRHNKKFGKQIQKTILLRRQAEKTESISSAGKQRKGLKQKMSNAEDNFGIEVEDDEPKDKSQRLSRKKRDAKFGFGGKKNNSRSKSNNSASFLEGRFNVKQNKAPMKDMGTGRGGRGTVVKNHRAGGSGAGKKSGGGGGGGGKGKRLGKSRRSGGRAERK